VVFALAVAGLAGLARRGGAGRGRFVLLLGLNLAAAPVAAALTSGTSALRSLLVGLCLLIFSCFGFALLAGIRDPRWRRAAMAAVALALALESGRYLADYFGPYVDESVWAFKSWDFRGALVTALAQRPSRIEVSQQGNQPYAHLEFYRRTLPHPPPIPMEMAAEKWPRAAPGVCIVYFNPDAYLPDAELYQSRIWGQDDPTILRCFGPPVRLPAAAEDLAGDRAQRGLDRRAGIGVADAHRFARCLPAAYTRGHWSPSRTPCLNCHDRSDGRTVPHRRTPG
jgi:hypothetical protein